jgi:hypothetical protein
MTNSLITCFIKKIVEVYTVSNKQSHGNKKKHQPKSISLVSEQNDLNASTHYRPWRIQAARCTACLMELLKSRCTRRLDQTYEHQ